MPAHRWIRRSQHPVRVSVNRLSNLLVHADWDCHHRFITGARHDIWMGRQAKRLERPYTNSSTISVPKAKLSFGSWNKKVIVSIKEIQMHRFSQSYLDLHVLNMTSKQTRTTIFPRVTVDSRVTPWILGSIDLGECGELNLPAASSIELNFECEVEVQQGTFTPVIEWDLAGYNAYGPPVVGQLDDDNGDGAINSQDTPDIVYSLNSGGGLVSVNGKTWSCTVDLKCNF